MKAVVRTVKGNEFEHPVVNAAQVRDGLIIFDAGDGTTVGYPLQSIQRYVITGVPTREEVEAAEAALQELEAAQEAGTQQSADSIISVQEALDLSVEGEER